MRNKHYSQATYCMMENALCVNCHTHNTNQMSLILVWKGHPFRDYCSWWDGASLRHDKNSQDRRTGNSFVKVVVLCCLDFILANWYCSPALSLNDSEDDHMRGLQFSGKEQAFIWSTSDNSVREVRTILPLCSVLPDVTLDLSWGQRGLSVFIWHWPMTRH